jgi:hypothetical protein
MMASGGAAFPFTRQYDNTLAYLYPLGTLARWGLGPLAALAGFAGGGWLAYLAILKRKDLDPTLWLVLAWVLPYFLIFGAAHTKFMRYWGPLTPFLLMLGAAMVWEIKPWGWRISTVAGVLLPTMLYALAFVNMYIRPHPWSSAQFYLVNAMDSNSVLVGEYWDEPILPKEIDAQVNWLSLYPEIDSLEKLSGNLETLAWADYFTVNSRRNYVTLARLPESYPLSSQFHTLLFDGSLGFELVFVSGRTPQLVGVELWPDRFASYGLTPPELVQDLASGGLTLGPADESFLVYDQPLVMVFYNAGRLTPEEMLANFEIEDH